METRSKLATVHYWTKNYSSRNGNKVSKIIIHHMAGNLDAKGCYNVWKNRQGSAHYAISSKGQIGQLIDEKYRAWSVANAKADSIAVTMELANDGGAKTNWHVSDKAIAKCIDLCVDICKRHGIKKLNYTGDTKGNLVMHRYYMATACPGPYLAGKFKYIAEQVNKKLNAKPAPAEKLYRVRKTWADAKSQIGAYKSLANAKKACKQGYHVFDDKGKVVYTPPAPKPPAKSKQDMMCEWAKKISAGNEYRYIFYNSNPPKSHQCPICHKHTGKKGWNCIGWTFAVWRHGADIKCNCSCDVIDNATYEKMLRSSDAEALKIAQKFIGIKDIKIIKNKSGVPIKDLKKGDILIHFGKTDNKYYHNSLYIGNSKLSEAVDDQTPNITYGTSLTNAWKKAHPVKLVIRYTGK